MQQLTVLQQIEETVRAIKSQCALEPLVGIVLGSGLGNLVQEISAASQEQSTGVSQINAAVTALFSLSIDRLRVTFLLNVIHHNNVSCAIRFLGLEPPRDDIKHLFPMAQMQEIVITLINDVDL